MNDERHYCAAVGIKLSQILEHFRHLFLYDFCSQCHEPTGVDIEVIEQVHDICIANNLFPMTLCSDCHKTAPPHKQLNITNTELEQKIDHIVAERN